MELRITLTPVNFDQILRSPGSQNYPESTVIVLVNLMRGGDRVCGMPGLALFSSGMAGFELFLPGLREIIIWRDAGLVFSSSGIAGFRFYFGGMTGNHNSAGCGIEEFFKRDSGI